MVSKMQEITYYCVIVDLIEHTFNLSKIKSKVELASKEALGWFGYGARFKSASEQRNFINYLKNHNFKHDRKNEVKG